MPYAVCPECDEDVYIPAKPLEGQQVVCDACGTELQVVSLDPLELDWPWEMEEEDE